MKPRHSMLALAVTVTLAACVSEPTIIPSRLDPDPNEKIARVVPAKGVHHVATHRFFVAV